MNRARMIKVDIILTCMAITEVTTLGNQVLVSLYSQINLIRRCGVVLEVLSLVEILLVSQVKGVAMTFICIDIIICNSQTTMTFYLGWKPDLVTCLRFH